MSQQIPARFAGGAVDLSHLASRGQQPQGQPGAQPPGVGGQVVDVPALVFALSDQSFEQAAQLSSVVPVVIALLAVPWPEVGERMHACGKLQYAALGRILQSRGVNIANTATFSAGQLYTSGNLVIGVANYPARVSESDRNTTGGIVRLYDILIAAAEELLPDATTDNLSKSAACAGVSLFNADNTCNPAGFGCFMGVPPTDAQINLCNVMVVKDTFDANILNRKRLAVAAMASPIWLCD